MATSTPPRLASAVRNSALSALIAQRAVSEARKARQSGTTAIAAVVVAHQVANAQTSEAAVAQMLAEQEIDAAAEALLNTIAFTTSRDALGGMLSQVETDMEFDRLVASIVQDAARAAESVAAAVRTTRIHYVRFVNPPCCARCAILAGRVYRWSEGFLRHPGCDCSMIPTTVASPLLQDPGDLVSRGLVKGLSKADMRALASGADLNQIVNIRRRAAGLMEAGEALTRAGRPTPAGIFRLAGEDHAKALDLLKSAGYLR